MGLPIGYGLAAAALESGDAQPNFTSFPFAVRVVVGNQTGSFQQRNHFFFCQRVFVFFESRPQNANIKNLNHVRRYSLSRRMSINRAQGSPFPRPIIWATRSSTRFPSVKLLNLNDGVRYFINIYVVFEAN